MDRSEGGAGAGSGREPVPAAALRVDKWLWAARVFRTRSEATAACAGGHVTIGGVPVKPAREVRAGDCLVVRTLVLTRTVRVVSVSERRVGPRLVPTVLDDLTPPEERERARQTLAQRILGRPPGAGRPTKRDRRQIEEFEAGDG